MNCFFVPTDKYVIDYINPQTGLSAFYGRNLDQMKEEYPGVEIWNIEDAEERIHQNAIVAPKEVTEDRFTEMLYVMPPMLWRGGGNTESFMLCEAMSGESYMIFCRVGSQFFEMVNLRSLTHQEIIDLCQPLVIANSHP